MSNAMRDRMSAAKAGAGASVKAKSAKAPLVEPTVELHVVPDATVTALPGSHGEETLAVAQAVDVLTSTTPGQAPSSEDDAPIVLPKINRADEDASVPTAAPATTPDAATPGPERLLETPRAKKRAVKGEGLIVELTAPPAAMGTAGESRVMSIPMSEDTYKLLQQLDRELALSRRRPVNRVRLVTTALEQVLADPSAYADRYLAQHNAGVTWKRRVQARVPMDLADQLPLLRYTGEHRQSAGMLVSIAVGDLLTSVRDALTTM